MKCKDIVRHFSKLESERRSIEGVWTDVAKFVVPFRGRFTEDTSDDEISTNFTTPELYDNTAVVSCQILAASLQSSMTPPAVQWFTPKFRDSNLNDNVDAQRWAKEVGETMFTMLQDSNFDLESKEVFHDTSSYGLSALVEEYDEEADELNFTHIQLREWYFMQDAKGNVAKFFRRMRYTTTELIDKFGIEQIPAKIIDKHNEGTLDKFEVIFVVYRDEGNNEVTGFNKVAPEKRPYQFKYVLRKAPNEDGEIVELKSGGYYEMPAFVPRWGEVGGSKYAYSPAMTVLADIKTLNKLVELILRSAEKAIDPPMLVTERGLLSDMNVDPSGVTVVRNLNEIGELKSSARFDVSELQRSQLQDAINRAFFINHLELKQSPAMTATEVMARTEMMNRLLGSPAARIKHDYLDQMLSRTFNIGMRQGKFPPMPDVIQGAEIEMFYTGALFRAQRQDSVQATQQWVAFLASIAELTPEGAQALDRVKFEDLGKVTAGDMNVNPELVRSDAETETKGQERAQQQQAMQQQALQQQTAQTANVMGDTSLKLAKAQEVQGG